MRAIESILSAEAKTKDLKCYIEVSSSKSRDHSLPSLRATSFDRNGLLLRSIFDVFDIRLIRYDDAVSIRYGTVIHYYETTD